MCFYVLIRKADAQGVNFWLRFLALGLSASLSLLAFYYFWFINRAVPVVTPKVSSSHAAAEQEKNDAALTIKVRSAMAQTKRLYSFSLGVRSRAGVVTLTGEVATEIDRELAANVAREIPGVQEVHNEIRVVTGLKRPGDEQTQSHAAVNVEDLELAANLREKLQATPELNAQLIQLKVQQRVVTLTGRVATEAQRQRAEQVLRAVPKVLAVHNQLRLGN